MSYIKKIILIAPLIMILAGCASTIAPFNEQAYEYATSAKAEAMMLLSKSADETYEKNKAEVEALKLKVATAYEFANGIPKNEHITKMWGIMMDTDRSGTLFHVLKMWKTKHKFHRIFVFGLPEKHIKGIKDKIASQFDQIIDLESGKNKQ